MNAEGAEFVMEAAKAVGALVMGRREFDQRMALAANIPWMSLWSS